MGISKRKQECKKTRGRPFDQESDQEKKKKRKKTSFRQRKRTRKNENTDCFLGRERVFFLFILLSCFFFFINSYLSVLQLPKNLQLQDLRLTLVSMVRVCNMHTRVYDMNAVSHAERNFGVFETILKSSCNTVLGSHSKQHSIIN